MTFSLNNINPKIQKPEGLLGACGGRNSEGEDFPGDFMNAVVVVGVPFQRSYSFFKCKN